ncbi:acyltransferase family protein [Herbidospora sp. NEAU-GS84]|uniref:Acyltransferase family protein n=1 Tax=Herbidospora solisilvae TaxID=2696284 RepID=A0A7C9K1Q3_9ACTN|nr:acyltransferase [Herbidospora solisilvae]NAS26979.1 acyltransferase family protein [Herbidospora solisilvae]
MTSSPEQTRGARLPSLTGLRFLAALLVFAFHTTWQTRFVDTPVFESAGFYGVTFFFVLSGFVLTWSARPGDTAPKVWRRRVVKIFPNHLVTFAVAGVLMLATAQAFTTTGTLANLFLLQAWIPDLTVPNTMNSVSWSLSCELFFYLTFPWILRLLNRFSARALWITAGALVAVTLLVPLVSVYLIGGQPLPFISDGTLSFEQIWFVYFFPPVRAAEFVLGVVAARLVLEGAWPRLGLAPALLVAVGGYVVQANVPYLWGIAGTAAIWLTPLVVAAAQADLQLTRSPFRGRALVRLGEWSFAFYMVHGLTVTYLHRYLVDGRDLTPLAGAGLLVLALAVALVLAWALFTFVETPAVRRFGVSRRDRAPRPPAPASQPLQEAAE